jgi:uncharacterized membrane protein YedE/YeeE
MWNALPDAWLAAGIGGAGGILLGLAARLGRFCTLGAIEDALYGNSTDRLRMWGVAMAVAITGTFLLMGAGLFEAGDVAYLRNAWNPLSHALGGLTFGYGMALAGNCGFGALARLGGGDLRSFVIVLVTGISAYVFMSGPFAALRITLFPRDLLHSPTFTGGPHLLASWTGLPVAAFGIAAGLALAALALGSATFRARRRLVLWGAVAGLAVPLAWAGTGFLAERSLGGIPVESYTFVAPLGETVLYAMTASGTQITFAVGSVLGVLAGAFVGSLIRGHFRWEACDDPRELRRQIYGGVLMGLGAVLALGCSIGQGLSAVSVLSFGAPITLCGIFVGAVLGLRSLISGGWIISRAA